MEMPDFDEACVLAAEAAEAKTRAASQSKAAANNLEKGDRQQGGGKIDEAGLNDLVVEMSDDEEIELDFDNLGGV